MRGRDPQHNPAYPQRDGSRARSLYTETSAAKSSIDSRTADLWNGPTVPIAPDATAAENKLILRRPDPKALFPKRTSYGTAHFGRGGPATEVMANYLRIQPIAGKKDAPPQQIYRYSLATPQELPKGKMRVLARKVLTNGRFDGVAAATDFSGIIITNSKLDLGSSDVWAADADIRDADEVARAPQQGQGAQVPNNRLLPFELKLTGTFTLKPLMDWLTGSSPNAQFPQKEEMLQILNIVFGYYALHNREHVFQIGRSNKFFYDSFINQNAVDLGSGLRALRGYIASVRLAPGSMMLNLNVVSGAFYKLIPLRNLAWQLLKGDRLRYDPGKLDRLDRKRLENMLRYVRIECHYMPALGPDGRPKLKPDGTPVKKKVNRTICSFNPPDYLPAKHQRFQCLDETTGQTRSVTVFDYFREKYPNSGFDVDHGWPVLNVGTRAKPTWIPLQLCLVSPAQAVKRMLSGDQTSAMINFAARPPNVNVHRILTEGVPMFKLALNEQANAHAKFGLEVATSLSKVPARFLQPPGIVFYENKRPNIIMGGWNLRGVAFFKPMRVEKVALVEMRRFSEVGGGRRNYTQFAPLTNFTPQQVMQEFRNQFGAYRLRIEHIDHFQCDVPEGGTYVNRADYQRAIDDTFKKLADQKFHMSIWLMEEKSVFTYSWIKKMGDVEHGVQSICLTPEKFGKAYSRHDPGFYGNIAMKMNTKVGGTNVYLSPQELGSRDRGIWNDTTMFVGIDVTHPAPGSSKATPSIAAVVANTDAQLAQWPGSVRRQAVSREEMVDALKDMVVERLQLWRTKNNNKLPTRIIVYRDGVSDGQFQLVLQHERTAINQAITAMYAGAPRPQMAIIVVTKRHHTRFYPTKREDMDTSGKDKKTNVMMTTGNCKPGLVVDRGVTDPEVYDFFLQPHAGLQGTVKPARYVVLHDELKMGADGLQRMTHTLCYLFNRATRAVSLCPPAYYADLLCERARCYLYHAYHEGAIGATEETDDGGMGEWPGHLHRNIKDTTFYI
ncbi:Piwi domain-containing protein [Elsinoe ampelina]|uniref:Piwi domain-containing protein n=1 Tax=Elsinoe ampelina TaxID=302913 RepID=A0A6A6G415_9PEZI|nr:Piwi domain-containing protein [Elsinoe ampelina]